MPSSPELLADTGAFLPSAAEAAHLLRHLQTCVCDGKGVLLYVNDRFCSASGYAREELLGQALGRLLRDGNSPQTLVALWSAVQQQREWRGELCGRDKQGKNYWIEFSIVPIDDPLRGGLRIYGIGIDITRLMQVEQQLQRSEQRFRGLAETIGAGIVFIRGERTLYVNRALERITGYSRQELLQMCFFDISHPDYPNLMRSYALARQDGEDSPGRYETVIRTKDGQTRWIEINAARVDFGGASGGLGTAIDITERKLAEQAQLHMQQLLQQIVDGNPVPTFVLDAEHRVTHWNHACALITGCAAADMLGTRNAWQAFYPRERPVLADLILSGDASARIENFYATASRQSPIVPNAFEAEGFFPHFGEGGRWLFFTAAPLRADDGRIVGAIETLIDISERKAAERALRHAHDELETLVERRTGLLQKASRALEQDIERREASEQELRRSNAELQALNQRLGEAQAQLVQSEKLASIGQLAAGVAHEINNPVGYLQSNLGTLERYFDDLRAVLAAQDAALQALPGEHPARQAVQARRQEHDVDFLLEDLPDLLRQSREGLERVSKIVANLKDFSRVDASQDWEWANLHEGLDSSINIGHNELKYRATVVREYGELPEVQCLPSQLNQVYLNLLVNAAQAMPEGRMGTIRVRTSHHPERQGGQVWIEIADDGLGIPPEHLKRIFDPFFTTKPIGKGTGLGLSLSYGIIQKHHGELQVTSTVGTGTTFRIVLPVSQATEEDT